MKKKGAITLEAAILVPILFVGLLLIIDLSLNAFIKSTVKSTVNNTLNSIAYELKAKNDDSLSQYINYDVAPSFIIDERLKRTISDEFHLGLDSGLIQNRIISSLTSKTLVKSSDISLSIKKYNLLFATYVIVDYSVKINTPMSGIYSKFGSELSTLKAKDKIVVKDYFGMIALSDSVSRALADNKPIAKLIDAINNFAYYVAKIMGG